MLIRIVITAIETVKFNYPCGNIWNDDLPYDLTSNVLINLNKYTASLITWLSWLCYQYYTDLSPSLGTKSNSGNDPVILSIYTKYCRYHLSQPFLLYQPSMGYFPPVIYSLHYSFITSINFTTISVLNFNGALKNKYKIQLKPRNYTREERNLRSRHACQVS